MSAIAYVNPSSRTTGELITSSIWNQDVVDNVIYLNSQLTALQAPTFVNDTRIWHHYLLGGLTGPVSGSSLAFAGAAATATRDATNKHTYYLMPDAGGGVEAIQVRADVFGEILPRCRFLVAHEELISTNVFRAGFGAETFTADPTNNGAYFRAAGNGNILSVCRNATNEATKDTAIAASTTVRDLEVRYTGDTTVEFYVDSVLKTTHTGTGAGERVPAASTLMRPRLGYNGGVSTDRIRIGPYCMVGYEVRSS